MVSKIIKEVLDLDTSFCFVKRLNKRFIRSECSYIYYYYMVKDYGKKTMVMVQVEKGSIVNRVQVEKGSIVNRVQVEKGIEVQDNI